MAKIGRPTLVQEREIRERLQKFLPDIYTFYQAVFKEPNTRPAMELKEKISKEILGKLVADVKAVELTGDGGGALEFVIIKDIQNKDEDE